MAKTKQRLIQLLFALLLLTLWQVGVMGRVIDPNYLPAPLTITALLLDLMQTESFVSHVLITVERVVFASVLASIPGIILGLIMGWSDLAKQSIYPLVTTVYPLPKIALLPLLMIILGVGQPAFVATAGMAAVFYVLLNSMNGIRDINELYFDVAKDYGASSTYDYFREVLLPGSLPAIFTGLRLTLSTALLVVISIEFVAAENGIGYFIWVSWSSFLAARMYAGIVIVAFLGFAITTGLHRLGHYLIPWQDELA